jgi:hypothetical protein
MQRPIVCEPRKDCEDPHIYRWHCMRGIDGAPDGICPLKVCEERGANDDEFRVPQHEAPGAR